MPSALCHQCLLHNVLQSVHCAVVKLSKFFQSINTTTVSSSPKVNAECLHAAPCRRLHHTDSLSAMKDDDKEFLKQQSEELRPRDEWPVFFLLV